MSDPRKGTSRAIASGGLVQLLPPGPEDELEFLGAVHRSVRIHRPWVYPPSTSTAFAEYLARSSREDFCAMFLRARDDRRLLGVFNLSQVVRGKFQNAYLGYYAFAPSEGRGFMSEGVALLLRYAFTRLKLHRVEANVQPENSRSIRLLERAGFRREGYSPRYLKIGGKWRDHERWAICREDLSPR